MLSDLVRAELKRKASLQESLEEVSASLLQTQQDHQDLLDAQKLLGAISEENTSRTLDHIAGVINKTLAQIFRGTSKRVEVSKTLHAGRYPHLTVTLVTDSSRKRDLDIQSGSGVKEVISFLFIVCLIAVRGQRKLLIMDEILSGLHRNAKEVILDLMQVFVEEGFQFIMVEYGVDTLHGQNFGAIWNVEQKNGVSYALPIPNGEYTPSLRYYEVPSN